MMTMRNSKSERRVFSAQGKCSLKCLLNIKKKTTRQTLSKQLHIHLFPRTLFIANEKMENTI